MIGIGVTTYNRPKHLELCLAQIKKHTTNYKLVVIDNVKGINKAKNKCLDELKGCEHVFLFDDDCFPIRDGWDKYIISLNQNHITYGLEPDKCLGGSVYSYNKCGGCFLYLSKIVLDGNIRFPEDFEPYGYEHVALSYSVYLAGLSASPYICPIDLGNFIYSLDFDGVGGYKLDHKPSLPFSEVKEYVKQNEVKLHDFIQTSIKRQTR